MHPIAQAPLLPANGAMVPAIGLGTYRMRGADCVRAVETALSVGYRHIDTAAMYDNEAEIGQAVRASGIPRDEIFLTTKVWTNNIGAGDLQKSARESLRLMQLERVDLLLIHWPNRDIPLQASIGALCEAKQLGLTRHIGVANFPSEMLEQAIQLAAGHGEKIAVNQCEYHPRLDQSKLLAACRARGVLFTSYCPIGQGGLASDPTVEDIARRAGKAPGQVVLRWHMQQGGVAAIPKSSQPRHLAENLDVFDFSLADADMTALSSMAVRSGRLVRPAFAPDWD